MKYFRLLIVTFVFCTLSSAFVSALTMIPLNLEQLTKFSQDIVMATPTEVIYEEFDYKGSTLLGANITLEVHEVLKGDAGSKIILFQLAQLSEDNWGISSRGNVGLPEYEIGQTFLFFLSERSENTDFTAPVGLSQGCFHMKQVDGKWMIPGLSKKKSLIKNMNKSGLVKALTPSQGSFTEDYATFKSVIKDLVEGK